MDDRARIGESPLHLARPAVDENSNEERYPKTRVKAIRMWEAAWKDLPQEKVLERINRIPAHIREAIDVDDRNKVPRRLGL
jgi:hypothetical protein